MPPAESLQSLLPAGSVLTSDAELSAYSYDAALDRSRPEAVVLARSASDVQRAVGWCRDHRRPFTGRGAGTNLSGGCIPLRGGIIVSLASMNRILDVDAAKGVATVEPGVVNGVLQHRLESSGFFYAPDPASLKVSTIGGNISENAGGPRCVKYGVTTNHVLAVEAVMPDGSLEKFSLEDAGPELMSLLVGAEGTLGLITKAWLKILPLPERIETLLVAFPSIEASIEAVSDIVAFGVLPRVLEALDRMTIESVEAYRPCGYPKAEAVLLIELDGPDAETREDKRLVSDLCRKHGASEIRSAETPAERERLWEGRRGAYAAMARLAPNVLVEDGVVPRDKLPELARRARAICAKEDLMVGLLFHAGDGNIHPNIGFDERDKEQTRRVKSAGFEILKACVELGGSLSGEHGIGADKRASMSWLFSKDTLGLFRRVKSSLDPLELSNPDKVIPLPDEEARARVLRPPSRALGPAAEALTEQVRSCAREKRPMMIAGSGSRLDRQVQGLARLETKGLDQILELDKGNLTLRVQTGISPRTLKETLARQGLFVKIPDSGGTLGGLLATKAAPGLRDDLLGMTLLLADGSLVELGGKVVKNVAGYDLPRLLLGSWGAYALILDVTYKLYARQPRVDAPRPGKSSGFTPNRWHRALKNAFDQDNLFNPWIFGSP